MRTFVCLVALLAAALPAAAQDKYIGGRYRLWQAEVDGDIRAEDKGLAGTDIELKDDFDIDADETMNCFGVWLGIPAVAYVVVDYWWGTMEGEETLSRDITFAGQTFTIGETVEARLDWRVLTVLVEYHVRPKIGDLVLRLGARIGAKLLFIDAEASSTLAGSEDAEIRGGAPVVGAVAELYYGDYFSVGMEIDGLKVKGIGGVSGLILDYSVFVRGGYGGFFAGVGYRSFRFGLEDEKTNVVEVEADVRIQGFFVEAGFRY